MKRRPGWLFWGVLALCLLVGLDRILADPDQPTGRSAVGISEFLAVNGAGILDDDQERSDWIEIHNRSAQTIDLEGWTLTDDPTQPDKWTFRAFPLAPGQVILVFASGKNRREIEPENGRFYLHTNFRLDSAGGFLALYPPTSRRQLDASVYTYPAQIADVAYGLATLPDGRRAPGFLEPATPGDISTPQTVWQGILPAVTFSAPHALVSAPISVTLSSPTPDAQIRYTTDGSTPTLANGATYTQLLTLTQTTPLRAVAFLDGYRPSPAATQSYLFLPDVLAQPAAPSGWPATWGTHRINRGPYHAGAPVEADYAVDTRVVQDAQDGPLLAEGLRSLPSLSLVTDMANLDIYADPQTRGRDTERPVSVEWIEPDGAPGFQVDAGVRIQGGAGRWEFMPKHSFRLFFRRQYGTAWLNYPLFPDSQVTLFDTLVLRAGVNYGFAGEIPPDGATVDYRRTTYLRDAWARASQLAASGVAAHGRFVHLYLNGLYWGLYEVVERPDASFASAYLGGDESSWASINHGGYVSGAADRFDVLLDMAQAGGLDDPDRYATFLEFFDPAQFSDYVLVNWAAGNRDWLWNNWYVDVRNPAGRNQFYIWDAEATWDHGANIRLNSYQPPGAPFPNITKLIFQAAWANPDFRMTFADRAYYHLFDDGALTDGAAKQRWLALQAQIDTAIVGESARWGDTRYPEQPIRRGDWLAANQAVLAQMDGNAARLLRLMTTAGYYPTLAPPSIHPRGGEFVDAVTVTLTSPLTPTSGIVYYTTDGSDPRTPASGEPSAHAQRYAEPLRLTASGRVLARTWVDGEWSPLHEVAFTRRGEQPHIVISEIMYNPYIDEQMEFLELRNVGTGVANLSGAYFAGIDYRFPDGFTVAPGGHVVLLRDLSRFRRRYPEVEIHGVYRGKLSDKGETLTLYAAGGEILVQVAYDDDRGWPLSADGAGDALVLVAGCADPTVRACWRASATLYGTPGGDEAGAR
jgi:hypothetical protein